MQGDKYEQRLAEIMTWDLSSSTYPIGAMAVMHRVLLRSIIRCNSGCHVLSTLHGLACVVKEYNMAFNKPKRNSKDSHFAQITVEKRLTLILTEVNSILSGQMSIRFVRSVRSAALQFMQIVIDLVLGLQTFDAHADDLENIHTDFRHCAPGKPEVLCHSSLCYFHTHICRSLKLVHELEPSVRLSTAQWRELEDSLTTKSNDVQHEYSLASGLSRSRARHRDGVKEVVLHAFEAVAPYRIPNPPSSPGMYSSLDDRPPHLTGG